ncbi:MAG: 50S ribosomal protein L21 [Parcubacteria group bacterium CG1_02_40_82]|uniref:Large ribosomal subunit protein bL21 n=4 Tax=Candidatus Portnoyibacteriota TaxID=1817913 RepID=A0A2M7IIZ4_9BACT|nr:MAG: 50S ribosomal protein L21 [Parcubacteria group bacterium CG1_02_40_82]PIQ75246.1 MAG: 50S ribosomal protein L21 [Candidatus Portnoybacteria bacterium CG11_big_fil_rev_8_21_14_0_20_40_15]PIS31890.1 MAG: 50S ribosomal protein L21 [Candidatus Portnoybacteria bacterium CG08_land_8_20_14_0_20_40_83]PIW76439.1 MAG: 50S ribosomal protein L21 [Candidatus Portnoybacteria bacterium CG_4_8_14_3_um_filter_40_10]PIY74595.1 MAG: 50S ribosomal protein L21 [Candidatus Portnoybacteria bacterium CG_4_10_
MEFAVIKTGGKQYKVAPGQKIKIEKLDAPEGKSVVFNEVLLVDDDKKVEIGQPVLKDAKVEGKVLKQDRADKVIILKYKAKKRYQVKRGHRQPFSLVEITKIVS